MNVFSKHGVRIDYAARLNRFSISNGSGWISVTPSVFTIIQSLALDENEHVKCKVQLNGLRVEIIKVSNNYSISYASKSTQSSITIHGNVMSSIIQDYDTIMDATITRMKIRSHASKVRNGPNRNSKYFHICFHLSMLHLMLLHLEIYTYLHVYKYTFFYPSVIIKKRPDADDVRNLDLVETTNKCMEKCSVKRNKTETAQGDYIL